MNRVIYSENYVKLLFYGRLPCNEQIKKIRESVTLLDCLMKILKVPIEDSYEKNYFKTKEIFKGFWAWGNHWSG